MTDRILVLAPHTDDGELGMGGTIARFVEEGKEIHYTAFSTADESLRDGFPPGTLVKEVKNATEALGIPESNVHIFPYKVRTFSYKRQEILEDIIKLKQDIDPTIVFSPTTRDLHQDHLVVANEAVRAFKKINMYAYEMPWNNINFNFDAFFELSEDHLQCKIDALSHYESQQNKDYMQPEFTRSLAKVRGVQINVPYAESFEVVRQINRL